jgi:excisionase family DNA binding protein
MNNHENRIIELLNEIKASIKNKVSDGWLSVSDVCKYSSTSASTIYRAEKSGALKASRQTGRLLFRVSDVDRWLNGIK